jgi:DNA-binding NarL/FixJ family response regulator
MSTKTIRLLIAEDQPMIRKSLVTLFEEQANVEVVAQAADGAEAIKLARAWRPDVALLDIKMPRVNGIEATRRITEESPTTHVVILTTFDADELVFDAIVAGAIGYLLKDAEEHEIVATVRDAARGHSRLSPTVARRVLEDFRRLKRPAPVVAPDNLDDPLTDRETTILDLIGMGKTNRDISQTLALAEGTVKNHVSNILSKLHARSRTELAIRAIKPAL